MFSSFNSLNTERTVNRHILYLEAPCYAVQEKVLNLHIINRNVSVSWALITLVKLMTI